MRIISRGFCYRLQKIWTKIVVITLIVCLVYWFEFNQSLSSDTEEDLANERVRKFHEREQKFSERKAPAWVPPKDFGKIPNEAFDPQENALNVVKSQFDIFVKMRAEEKAERKRIAAEKAAETDPQKLKESSLSSPLTVASVHALVVASTVAPTIKVAKRAAQGFVKPPNIFGVESLGEMGNAVTMPSNLTPEIKKLFDEGWAANSFNQYLSDLISVQRKLPDLRTNYCLNAEPNYSKSLPATSVIIIYHKEAWSTLLRSVHSVLDRSPEHLITEIILVDDFSDMDHLKELLDDYMSKFPKVKILRAAKREGLIKARLRGALVAKGPVLTFLDSHIECTPGWLEPLLARVAENPTTVACPVIDLINDTTFGYQAHSNYQQMKVGGFDWTLTFRWHTVPDREHRRKKDPSEPTRSPTMAGGLFSINKAFFQKLGMYDPDFDIWGGENLELSFKTWMCGGTLEIVPCSHVGHIFRKKSPYKWRNGVNAFRNNCIRLAEVWIDDYKRFFYTRTGPNKSKIGDLSERKKFRESLGCKSFKWYLETIYPELKIPSNAIAYGEIKSVANGDEKCLDSKNDRNQAVSLVNCHGSGGNQYWEYNEGKICRDSYCFNYEDSILMIKSQKINQLWTYRNESQQLYQKDANKCLAITLNLKLSMEDCIKEKKGQKWLLPNLVENRLKSF